MTRNAQRKPRPAAAPTTAPQNASIEGSSAELAAADAGWQRTLDLTRALCGASLAGSREWMQGLGDWQQAQAATLRHACPCLEQIADQAEHAPDWPALWASLAKLPGTQWTQAFDDGSTLLARAMQIESRLVERGRADSTSLSQRWLGETGDGRVRERPAAGEPGAPLAWLGQAQAAMSEMSRLWTQALYDTTLPD